MKNRSFILFQVALTSLVVVSVFTFCTALFLCDGKKPFQTSTRIAYAKNTYFCHNLSFSDHFSTNFVNFSAFSQKNYYSIEPQCNQSPYCSIEPHSINCNSIEPHAAPTHQCSIEPHGTSKTTNTYCSIEPHGTSKTTNTYCSIEPQPNLSNYCSIEPYIKQANYCSIEPQAFSSIQNTQAGEDQEQQFYAKAKHDCTLYSSNTTNESNTMFTIPEGYFVKLIDTSSDIFEVQYLDKVGFVKSKSVKRVSIIPKEPFLQPFGVQTKSGSGTQLRALPTTSSESLALIPPSSEVVFIATANGTKPSDGLSSKWYFVRFFPASEPTSYYEGYIYSERVSTSVTFPENTEDDPIIPLPLATESTTTQTDSSQQSSPAYIKGLLIAVLSLPIALFIIYIVTKMIKRKSFDEA